MTPEEIRRLPFASLIDMGEFDCCCGKRHGSGIRHVVIQSGAVQRLPELLAELRQNYAPCKDKFRYDSQRRMVEGMMRQYFAEKAIIN